LGDAAQHERTAKGLGKSLDEVGGKKERLAKNFSWFGGLVRNVFGGISKAWDQFSKKFVGAGNAIFGELERAFPGLATFTNPIHRLQRGITDIVSGFRMMGTILTNPSFTNATKLFNVLGFGIRGVFDITGALIQQMGRLAAFPFRAIGGAMQAIFSGPGKMLGGMFGFVGRGIGFAGDIVGGLASVFGKAFGGIADVAAAALKPIAGIFDTLISPITGVFQIIKFAWQYSLVAMTFATTKFLKSAVSEFIEFEKGVSKILVRVPGTTGASMGRYGAAAMGISRRTGASPLDTPKALESVAGAGFKSVFDATRVAEAATKLSVASFAPIEKATDAVTNLLEGFSLGSEHAERAAEVLFAGMRQGSLDMSDFATGVGKLAPQFSQLGSSMEDLVGTAAILSKSAAGEASVFNELAQTVQRIVSPTDGAAKAMRAMRIELQRNATGGVDVAKTLETVGARIRKLSSNPAVQSKLLGLIVPGGQGGRAQRSLLRLMTEPANEIKSILDAVASPGGGLGKWMDIMGNTMPRQLQELKSAWERLKITVGESLKPIYERGVLGATAFLDAIEKAANSGQFAKLRQSIEDMFSIFVGGDFTNKFIGFFAESVPNAINNHVIPALQAISDWTHGFDIRKTLGDGFAFLEEKLESLSESEFVKNIDSALQRSTRWMKVFVDVTILAWDTSMGFLKGLEEGWNNVAKAISKVISFLGPVGSFMKGLGLLSKDLLDYAIQPRVNYPSTPESFQAGSSTFPTSHASGGVVPGGFSATDNRIIKVRSGEEIVTPEDPRHIRNIRGFAFGGTVGGSSFPKGAMSTLEELKELQRQTANSAKSNNYLRDILNELKRRVNTATNWARGVGGAGGAAPPAIPPVPGGRWPPGFAPGGGGGAGIGPPPGFGIPPFGPPPGFGGRSGRPLSPREEHLAEVRAAHELEMARRRDAFRDSRHRVGGAAGVVPGVPGNTQEERRARREAAATARQEDIDFPEFASNAPKTGFGQAERQRAMRDAGRRGIHPGMVDGMIMDPRTGMPWVKPKRGASGMPDVSSARQDRKSAESEQIQKQREAIDRSRSSRPSGIFPAGSPMGGGADGGKMYGPPTLDQSLDSAWRRRQSEATGRIPSSSRSGGRPLPAGVGAVPSPAGRPGLRDAPVPLGMSGTSPMDVLAEANGARGDVKSLPTADVMASIMDAVKGLRKDVNKVQDDMRVVQNMA
jgi:TP901 family phage tail tape measure protein